MSPQTLVLATRLIGAAAAVLGVEPAGVVDDVLVVDVVELHAASIRVVAARAPTAAAIPGRKRVVMRSSSGCVNENGNRFGLTIEHSPVSRIPPRPAVGRLQFRYRF